ncbi:SusC/RagA family TonB-linked outer membrane protein [Pararcticibacter amylolyticus]|uniref:SusC/RagA family protein n=1 Tax=Pararcticibacter amylolyticus TaxID=2173175 RepID=A0A2U2PI80_9SPHI|nr:TonB-dependent receptor [Pararcticibacter amylolyticus]PWG80974.1 SusC/RagA family protein [Pararcticibacter amylolyticus]
MRRREVLYTKLWGLSMPLSILICLFLANATPVSATGKSAGRQDRIIKGTVRDAETKEALIGVSILLKGTQTGVSTDINGKFSIKVQGSNPVLTFSYLAYKKKEITVGSGNELQVVLQPEAGELNEVVVIGYGVQKKKLVTGATVQVSGENLQKLSTTSPLTAMQSQSPGVNIVQSSGQPGEGFKVNIRGLGTIGHSSPLYVIDGVPSGDINNLNPADIESVDVLKDAASAAIYGARAANGVILVTTRQGKSGKTQVSYDGYTGVQNVYKMPELLDARQYMNVINTVQFNEGLPLTDWKSTFKDAGLYESIENGTWKGTNWLDAIRNEDAPIQNHTFNLTGGNETSKFSLGVGYTSQEGIFGKPVQSDFGRTTVRINSDHVIYKNNNRDIIKMGERLYYNYNTRRGISTGNQYWNDISNMLRGYPIMPIYGADGKYFDMEDKIASGLQDYEASFANPIASMDYQRGNNMTKNHMLNMNAYVEIEPIPNLTFKSQFGYQFSANSYRQFTPTYELSNTTRNLTNSVQQNAGLGWSYSLENTLNYRLNIAAHHFDILAGQSIQKSGMGESVGATNSNLLWNDMEHAWIKNSQGVSAATIITGAPWDPGSIASFFGRINYNYKETYLASFILRADGSTNFARGHRWGYFPSASVGWVVTNEPFMDGVKSWMDFFKIRGSWGQNGNQNIPNFQYLATISFGRAANYSFNNNKTSQSTGSFATNLANEDISWETSEQLDIGFDARFLKSRLTTAFDWYKKSTWDWLLQAPVLASYGANAPYVNGGDVENKGIELGLGWSDHLNNGLTYGINLNMSKNINKVTRIANTEGIIHGPSNVLSQGTGELFRAEVGKPIGYFWGYKTAGVFQNQTQIDEWRAAQKPTLQTNPQPGDLIFVDNNNDGVINIQDKTQIGSPLPDYRVGFSINLGYKGFDLSATASGAFGQQIARSYRKFGDSYKDNYTTEVYNYWHGEGTSNRYPRLTAGNKTNWIEVSDIYIEDADYVKMQNITLGYDFKRLAPKMPFREFRVFLTAQNLFTITKYPGMDPEIGTSSDDTNYGWASGIDIGFYPNPRTYLIGVGIKF